MDLSNGWSLPTWLSIVSMLGLMIGCGGIGYCVRVQIETTHLPDGAFSAFAALALVCGCAIGGAIRTRRKPE